MATLNLDALSETDFAAVVKELDRLRALNAELVAALEKIAHDHGASRAAIIHHARAAIAKCK